jgi:voltage-gated potassium channel
MTAAPTVRQHGNAYEIFILVLTVLSLVVMVLLVVPIMTPATQEALLFFDNAICFVFLADFAYNITGAHPKSAYFIRRRGWLDLLGSVPSLGFFKYTALLRLARLSRLARIMRLLGGQHRRELIDDILRNRSQYAMFLTLLLVFIVLTTGSLLVLQFESRDPDANIQTGGDALWWAFVTLTTVGYGDFYPVTTLGRVTGVGVMAAGIGLIGALASLLASLLVSPPPTTDEVEDAMDGGTGRPTTADAGAAMPVAAAAAGADGPLMARLEAMQAELAAIRGELRDLRGAPGDDGLDRVRAAEDGLADR